ncbi:hypothetical protein RSOLAG1IB_08399 [Rhizoctonia solani AG-1 IB]|uniref:CBF1-interacting co-repressor CIR N-terminal domain-containing protein n=1 Tax=Thanatephorus cucumeris (strain AG1-IB / isolate 7/3/14) TaxID=1108050 RepID=A0A0B7FGP7_THACB|nr:hypothetical protein RSOLAG1IB_08399 [Rhizoctonia solani AG-1 IB]
MGKLNIAHHKSYHPYRADNIERVRRDEEEARLKEAIEDGRVSLADSEARITLLRERAKAESKPSKHKQEREEEKLLQSKNPLIAGPSSPSDHHVTKEKREGGALTLTASSGHINLFEELEYSHQNTLEHSGRAKSKAEIDKAKEKELERGVPLMPDEKDRRPWYMDKGLKHPKDMTDEEAQLKEQTEPENEREKWGKRSRGNKTSSKTSLDPLKDMQSHLAARSRALSSRSSGPMPPPAPPRTSTSSGPKDATTERTTREAAERARAEALIAKRRAEMDATSSVGGDTPYSVRDGGYSDMFNKKETREAHHAWEQRRGRYSDRRWDEDRDHRDRRGPSESRRSESRGSHRQEYDGGERHRDRDRNGDRDRERDRGRERSRDLPRGERNRTRGVDDLRRRS